MTQKTDDLRIQEIKDVIPPVEVHEALPVTEQAATTVGATRAAIHRLLTGEDDRLLVITGPCSIHDPDAAREYAVRLKPLIDALAGDLLIVMRIYFEKPRTTVGWKGLINDPDLDGSFRINKGLRLARSLLRDINEMGVPAGTEFLDILTPQYIADLVSWGAIGARTTESQLHREMASGLSCPVGFKNGTDGNMQIAVDAIRAASRPHHFLSLTKNARSAIFSTTGNEDCHLILRGGKQPNYDSACMDDAAALLEKAGLPARIMVDLSHANSRKQAARQVEVAADVKRQLANGDRRIFGVMVESHLVEGTQKVVPGQPLVYGQSITDACIGWDDTVALLEDLAEGVRARRSADASRVVAAGAEDQDD